MTPPLSTDDKGGAINRTTDTLFLRMDPPLVRTVKEQAKTRGVTISQLVEQARTLQAYTYGKEVTAIEPGPQKRSISPEVPTAATGCFIQYEMPAGRPMHQR